MTALHGKVYVADSNNHRIQVFTAKGVFLTMLGSHGQGSGKLDYPVSVASDMVYVGDYCNHRVSVFTQEGQFDIIWKVGGGISVSCWSSNR